MNNGWIKLYRGLLTHWIFSDAKKFKWWVTILLKVNHEPKKILLGNNLVEVGKGESVRSLRSWAMEFNTTPKTVKTFFSVLESDGMIETKSIGISTHLKVCNWDDYQEVVNTKETQSKRKVNTKETVGKHELPTNKNEKNDKNEKNKEQFDFSFADDDFLPTFKNWLEYKKKRNETYKTQQSVELAYKKLLNLSGNNPKTAREVTEQSMANNWAGLFELKTKNEDDIPNYLKRVAR